MNMSSRISNNATAVRMNPRAKSKKAGQSLAVPRFEPAHDDKKKSVPLSQAWDLPCPYLQR